MMRLTAEMAMRNHIVSLEEEAEHLQQRANQLMKKVEKLEAECRQRWGDPPKASEL